MLKELKHLKTYVIKIERGDYLKNTIETLAKNNNWKTARISAGIGAVTNIDIAYFDLLKKEYQHKIFEEESELISVEGNITINNNQPFIHWHACLCNTSYQAFGGHLFDAQVTVTCELFIDTYQGELSRIPCEAIGLDLIDI